MTSAASQFDRTTQPSAKPPWPVWAQPPELLQPTPGAAGVAEALTWLEALGESQAWPMRALMGLTLCADEALTNIASYALQPNGQPARMWLSCGTIEGGLGLCIEDDGAAFDPTTQEPPALAASLDEARIGGHGLRLMRHYLRQLRYRREGERNVLLLEVEVTAPT